MMLLFKFLQDFRLIPCLDPKLCANFGTDYHRIII
uniref:Uncharacterized protein n=1 Tax=Rhizophora mucronata TaxID=61149 RepID=A0A2P2P378_RHIMU